MLLPLPSFLNLPGAVPPNTAAALRAAAGLHVGGALAKAREAYQAILAQNPGHGEARLLAALADLRLGAGARAVAAMEALVQARPDDALARAALGAARLATGDAAAAEGLLAAAGALRPRDAQIPHLLAIAVLARKDRAAAERHLRAALDRDPGLWVARLLLVVLLVRSQRLDEAAALLHDPPPEPPAAEMDPVASVWRTFAPEDTYLEAARELAAALQAEGRDAEAIAACGLMVHLLPNQGRRHYDLGIALEAAGRIVDSLAAYQQAVRVSPGAYPPHAKVGSMLLVLGRLPEAIAACRECLRLQPGHAHALGHLAVALDEVGEGREAALLLDFDRLVRPRQFREDEVAGGLARLNADLRQALLTGADLKRLGNAVLTQGIDVDDIFPATRDPFDRLEALIRRSIAEYVAALPEDARHPYLACRPRTWWLKAWGTVLESGGWQAAHLHMEGWLSGTYYVAVPEAVRRGESTAGHLMLGRPPERMPLHARRRVITVRPAPGLTVMFPSYVFHQTVPFESLDPRLTISYDLRPAD